MLKIMSSDSSTYHSPDGRDIKEEAIEASLSERLAIVEERTKPVKKGVIDSLKAWGGLASLVIALAYSFPLGLWDRFVTTPERKQAQELEKLREVIFTISEITIQTASAVSGVSDPLLRDNVMRASSTRIFLLMQKNKNNFLRRKNDFVAVETLHKLPLENYT